MIEKRYCQYCERKINEGTYGGFGKEKFYEFVDGVYCEKCAKYKVDKSRSNK